MSSGSYECCGHCGFPVYDDESLSCPYCGRLLDRSAGFVSGLTRGRTRWFGVLVAILLLIGLLLWLVGW